jgi:hypothetical protein
MLNENLQRQQDGAVLTARRDVARLGKKEPLIFTKFRCSALSPVTVAKLAATNHKVGK